MSQYVLASLPTENMFEAAIQALEQEGVARSQISVLSNADQVPAQCDPDSATHVELQTEDDRQQVRVLLTSLAGTVAAMGAAGVAAAATGGLAVPAIAAGALAGGGVIGIGELLGAKVERDYHDWAERQIREGGLLLMVTTRDAAQTAKARDALRSYCGDELRVGEV